LFPYTTLFRSSFDDLYESKRIATGTYFEYSTRNLYIRFKPTYVGENFNAEVGFVPSYGVYPGQIYYQSGLIYRHYPEHPSLIWMGPSITLNQTYIPGGTLTDKDYILSYSFNFINTAILEFSYNYVFQQLTNDFNPVGPGRYIPFLTGEQYSRQNVSGSLQSSSRRVCNFLIETMYVNFYYVIIFYINGHFNYRYEPFGNVSFEFDYNDL